MFKIKAMFTKEEGYKTVQYVNTEEQAREYIRALRVYHRPIDAFYARVF